MFVRGRTEAVRSFSLSRLCAASSSQIIARRGCGIRCVHASEATGIQFLPGSLSWKDRPPVSPRFAVALDKLRSSVYKQDVNGVHAHYQELMGYLPDARLGKTLETVAIDQGVVLEALTVLAVSASPRDLALVDEILTNVDRFGMQVDIKLHDAVLQGFLRRGAIQGAYAWLSQMHLKPGGCKPNLSQFHALLDACGAHKAFPFALSTIQSMQQLSCPPTNATLRTICEALSRGGHELSIDNFRDLVSVAKIHALPFDSTLLRIVTQSFINAGHFDSAEEAEALYLSAFGLSSNYSSNDTQKDSRLFFMLQNKGKWSALGLYKALRNEGFQASHSTLQAMLYNTADEGVLRFWEKAFSLRASPRAWGKLIQNAIRMGQSSTAVSLYRSALASGVRPTNAMLHPVLRALCAPGLRPPGDASIDHACKLYHEYISLHDKYQKQLGEGGEEWPADSTQPDAPIYNTLLRALLSSTNTEKYFPIALSLLEDLRSREVTMDSMTIAAVVVLLIRSSSDFDEAFKAYKLICHQDGSSRLDVEGYSAVLNAFSKLSERLTKVPSIRLYFEIVKDMRFAGHEVTPKVYTVLLQSLAKMAKQPLCREGSDFRARLASSIRRIHNFLNVDASLKPDTFLWNQLMDTYQRTGCFVEAFRVWDALYRSREFNEASVSIIIDACGRSGRYDTALRLYANLEQCKFTFNERHWNSWLECLCRLGRVDDALKVLCLEMGKGTEVIKPSVENVRILLKFASYTNFEGEVRTRIKQYLPDLWKTLPAEMRGGRF